MKIMNPKYLAQSYPTPDSFKNKFLEMKCLIIGTGPSTSNLIEYKDKIKEKFDVIIGVNFATKDFEQYMDFHVVSEKNPFNIYMDMNKNSSKNRKDLVRVFNWKTIHKYPKNLTYVKMTRNYFDGDIDIRNYRHKSGKTEGLLVGPISKDDGLSVGTVILQALHLACILGCNDIYLSGADLIFSEEYDHYYKDRLYRDNAHRDWQTPIIEIEHNNKKYKTMRMWRDSAKYINTVISTQCKQAGISIYSFSDGIITDAIKVNIDRFFNG